jgi:predicted  nucleic acid-binding Zn-ribbon protein
MATTKTNSKTTSKTNTKNDVSKLRSESQALRTRISSLVDELYVLRGELDTFKKQVSADLETVVTGLNNLSNKNR